jgi:signal peptidase I
MMIILFVVLILFFIAYYITVVGDAIYIARKYGAEYKLKKYNKWFVYIGFVIIASFMYNTVAFYIKNNLVQAYRIPSGSNKPTLLIGDHILTDRRKSARNPQRGDFIIFEFPEDPEKDFLKRVVAMGGDTIEIRDKVLLINNEPVVEDYVIHKDSCTHSADKSPRDNYGPVNVPENACFVMGDNRDHSYDSRFWGFVNVSKIKGKVKSIYWSWDGKNKSVRWDRIGLQVR